MICLQTNQTQYFTSSLTNEAVKCQNLTDLDPLDEKASELRNKQLLTGRYYTDNFAISKGAGV